MALMVKPSSDWPQIRRLDREVHTGGARQQNHDWDLIALATIRIRGPSAARVEACGALDRLPLSRTGLRGESGPAHVTGPVNPLVVRPSA